MKIGDLAQESGCSVQTIRFYEKRGLLATPDRTTSNYRDYKQEHLEQLLFIKRCRRFKLSLNEIQDLFTIREQPADDCKSVTMLIEQHIAAIELELEELYFLKQQLLILRNQCDLTKKVSQCGIIKNLRVDEAI